jgi:hypothetical protein
VEQLGAFLDEYLAYFQECYQRSEQRQHGETFVKGLLSDLDRKSIEPIALRYQGIELVRPMQFFFQRSPWIIVNLYSKGKREIGRSEITGRYILFACLDGENKASLWLVRPDGSGLNQVVEKMGPVTEEVTFVYYGAVAWNELFAYWPGVADAVLINAAKGTPEAEKLLARYPWLIRGTPY